MFLAVESRRTASSSVLYWGSLARRRRIRARDSRVKGSKARLGVEACRRWIGLPIFSFFPSLY